MAKVGRAWHHFPVVFLEPGDHVDGRSTYEDSLDAELEHRDLGEVLGGGSSTDDEGCDIDLRVSDPAAGVQAVREMLRDLAAPPPRRSSAPRANVRCTTTNVSSASACGL